MVNLCFDYFSEDTYYPSISKYSVEFVAALKIVEEKTQCIDALGS